MSNEGLVRQVPLTQQMRDILASRIRDGEYPPGSQLPPENELAAEFDVSRATVRSALSSLAAQGSVVRRQGAGTFVTAISAISNPISEAIDFQDLIASFGYQPGVEHAHFAAAPVDSEMAEVLQVEPESSAWMSHRVFLADGQPVIYCVNTLPNWLFGEGLIHEVERDPNAIEPIYDFLERSCGQRVELHVSKIFAATAATSAFHGGLPLDPCDPVLVMDGVAYNSEMRPLFHTYEYHHHANGLMILDLIRCRRM